MGETGGKTRCGTILAVDPKEQAVVWPVNDEELVFEVYVSAQFVAPGVD